LILHQIKLNSFFETTYLFSSYSAEHLFLLIGFVVFFVWFIRFLKEKQEAVQQRILLVLAIILTTLQLAKIPLNHYTGVFDVTKDIPLHMCNFLPMIMIWVYATKNRTVWAAIFFWIILGVSQANFTPSVEFSLFHYDAIRYWMVHLMLVLLGLYPAIVWGWDLELKDVGRSFIALNLVAGVIYVLNLILDSNYLYVMDKPPGTTFFSLLPEWPYYILVLEAIIIVWSLMVWGVFRVVKRRVLVTSPK
jgi:hypothetical integral membrane protein (TIGR02206 family)